MFEIRYFAENTYMEIYIKISTFKTWIEQQIRVIIWLTLDWLLSYASSIFIYNASIDFKLERPETIKNDDGDRHFRWEIISEMIFSFCGGKTINVVWEASSCEAFLFKSRVLYDICSSLKNRFAG